MAETDRALAARLFKLPEDEVHTLSSTWNGIPTVFVDFVRNRDGDAPERPLMALQQTPQGAFRKILVTVGETEGGEPDVAAVGFANADRDAAKELIVILAWNQAHAEGCSPFREVRIFDDPDPTQASLRKLPLSKHFGAGCQDKPGNFRFTTIAAVKRELGRLGY